MHAAASTAVSSIANTGLAFCCLPRCCCVGELPDAGRLGWLARERPGLHPRRRDGWWTHCHCNLGQVSMSMRWMTRWFLCVLRQPAAAWKPSSMNLGAMSSRGLIGSIRAPGSLMHFSACGDVQHFCAWVSSRCLLCPFSESCTLSVTCNEGGALWHLEIAALSRLAMKLSEEWGAAPELQPVACCSFAVTSWS